MFARGLVDDEILETDRGEDAEHQQVRQVDLQPNLISHEGNCAVDERESLEVVEQTPSCESEDAQGAVCEEPETCQYSETEKRLADEDVADLAAQSGDYWEEQTQQSNIEALVHAHRLDRLKAEQLQV